MNEQLTEDVIEALFEMHMGDSVMMLPPTAALSLSFLYNYDYCSAEAVH